MGKYDKFAETKIDKIIKESARNASLANTDQESLRPKALAVSRREGHHHMMAELQGE